MTQNLFIFFIFHISRANFDSVIIKNDIDCYIDIIIIAATTKNEKKKKK